MEKPNNDSIIVFTRGDLNDMITDHLASKFEVNDQQWEQVVGSIHNDDHAWSYMGDAIDKAVDDLADAIKHELSCH